MGAPIRSSTEITLIINRAQHAIADLGTELVDSAKRGEDSTNDEDFRDNMYRLIILRIQLQNILDDDGEIIAFYQDADNEKIFNKILDGIARLSQFYGGSAIPLLTGKRIPLYFFPSTAGLGSGGNTNSGSGEATPGGTTFENTSVNTPGELVDSFDASSSNFALFTYSAYGQNSGEGSRSGMILASIRGATATLFEVKTPDNGGITSPLTFSAAIVDGMFELTADVTTDGWLVRGVRILFQNITFQNPLGPLPAGGSANQLLRKISGTDYDVEWKTLVWAMITDITASLTEINYVTGVTSPLQTQITARALKTEVAKLLGAGNTQRTWIELEIDDWDMTTDFTKDVLHSIIDWESIRIESITIRRDNIGSFPFHYPFPVAYNDSNTDRVVLITTDKITLGIKSGGPFNIAAFSSTGYNRGFITLSYIA